MDPSSPRCAAGSLSPPRRPLIDTQRIFGLADILAGWFSGRLFPECGRRAGAHLCATGRLNRCPTTDFWTVDDWGPSWSPKGGTIAFLRRAPVGGHVYRTSVIGGAEVKLSDFAAWAPISWSPDEVLCRSTCRVLRVRGGGIWLLPLEGGSPRPSDTSDSARC